MRRIALSLFFLSAAGCAAEPEPSKDTAIAACHRFVKERLRAPSSAQFPPDGLDVSTAGGIYAISGAVDAQNGFGALIRGRYSCTVEWLTGGIYNPKDVTLTGL